MQQDVDKSCWHLPEWLDYLEHRHSPEVQLRLVNARAVADILGVLKWNIPVITVGGTNGKGSTVAALSAIYQAAGYQTGQFTSPHLLTFNERICLNQNPIADDQLCDLFFEIEQKRQNIPLTYFEMSFLAALLYFKKEALDLIILEVGVGGRLDATNIIDADLSIITTVDLDHQDYLGHDKEAIGFEKAGILRQGKPFIYADKNPPQSVLKQATVLNTNSYILGEHYHYRVADNQLYLSYDHLTLQLPLPRVHPNAAAAAVMASLCLQARLPVDEDDWKMAMQTMEILGRRQWIVGDVCWLYDVAHNPQAVSLLAQTCKEYPLKGKVHAIFSALKDKDICGLIRPLSSFVEHWYPTCLTGKRASNTIHLQEAFKKTLNRTPTIYEHPIHACQAALAAAQPGDLILVYGSFVLVGAVMDFMQHHQLGDI
ncbi:MAG TPA: folylpolyglutamate synthase/dihydrofolate synthase family protein [Legionellaceae bacterium]|nr:folylpolyglutamate synthase/dihydrofolate synthase family protein [Legionellaceae bacterium]